MDQISHFRIPIKQRFIVRVYTIVNTTCTNNRFISHNEIISSVRFTRIPTVYIYNKIRHSQLTSLRVHALPQLLSIIQTPNFTGSSIFLRLIEMQRQCRRSKVSYKLLRADTDWHCLFLFTYSEILIRFPVYPAQRFKLFTRLTRFHCGIGIVIAFH